MEVAEVVKIKLNVDSEQADKLLYMAKQYSKACNYVSEYIFNHDFPTNSASISRELYSTMRSVYGLKSQMALSAVRTTVARYKAVNTSLKKKPYKFRADDGKWYQFQRDMTWLQKPILFSRPQADLVRNRDYSYLKKKNMLSLNTLDGRIYCTFALAPYYRKKFFDGTWTFGTGKIVNVKGSWYFHLSVTKEVEDFQRTDTTSVVGIDRGLRFLTTEYDNHHDTHFVSGKKIMRKRAAYDTVRAQLQHRGTKSAKRALKRISGKENRWMSDENHCISKTLNQKYGKGTLFVLEDLEGVSTDERNLHGKKQSHDLRNWAFYDLEMKLTYKAHENGSEVLKVKPDYTSQRCPRCGRIYKENRNHKLHEYKCDKCGFTTNDDRVGAMNIYLLGTMWVSGNEAPSFLKSTGLA